jgi:hypothetical protein
MSLTSPAHARNLQTNINASRYFFATQEAGEQELFLSTIGGGGPNGNISSLAVGISGPSGNAVVISEGPTFMASEFISADQGAVFGSGSTYWTASSITSSITGVSLSTDRAPGSGIAAIESYAGNGSFGGFEFLTRSVNSALVSTTSVGINNYISSIGRPGAAAVLGQSGTLVTGSVKAAVLDSVDLETTGGGKGCYSMSDLSGGTQEISKWSIGMTGAVGAGGVGGSDFALYAYKDNGTFGLAPLLIQRTDGSMAIQNISSIFATAGGQSRGQVFPMKADNTEFGADSNVEIMAGATSNQALFGTVWAPLFSTPVSSLNPNYETLLNINWANTLSTGSNHVNFKIGFSTATAYTNIVQTSYVPGLGGSWTPSDQPGLNTPLGHTNICCVLDSDGLSAQGDGVLFVAGQFSDPNAPADQIFIAKGTATEPQRNALTYKTI